MTDSVSRRSFLLRSANVIGGVSLMSIAGEDFREEKALPFRISLAEWSLHRALFAGTLDNLDFARTANKDFGIEAVEYVNQFFKDKAKDQKYLVEMKKRAGDL